MVTISITCSYKFPPISGDIEEFEFLSMIKHQSNKIWLLTLNSYYMSPPYKGGLRGVRNPLDYNIFFKQIKQRFFHAIGRQALRSEFKLLLYNFNLFHCVAGFFGDNKCMVVVIDALVNIGNVAGYLAQKSADGIIIRVFGDR